MKPPALRTIIANISRWLTAGKEMQDSHWVNWDRKLIYIKWLKAPIGPLKKFAVKSLLNLARLRPDQPR